MHGRLILLKRIKKGRDWWFNLKTIWGIVGVVIAVW